MITRFPALRHLLRCIRGSHFVLAAAVLAVPAVSHAQTTIVGSLSNFDVQNHTESEAEGFEIQLEGLQVNDIQGTFGEAGPGGVCYIRYCSPVIIPYATGVYVRWAAGWDPAAQQFTTRFNVPGMNVGHGTPIAAPSLFVSGHECWSMGLGNAYPNSGCEHFGVVTARNPTQTTYRWLVADPATPGALMYAAGGPVPVPAPAAQIQPAAGGGQDVDVAIQGPAPLALNHRYGKAQWVKVYKKEIDRHAHLDELMGQHPNHVVPNADDGPAETEWKLLQLDVTNPDKGSSQLQNHGGSNSHGVVRRYEFYEYTGPVVPPGQVSGRKGSNLLSDDQEASNCPRDLNGECTQPGPGELGNFIGAQMAAQNLAQAGELEQSIDFAPLLDRNIGDPSFQLSASGGASGNPVVFGVVGACSLDPVDGRTLSLLHAGGCVIIASQAGDGVYAPAPEVVRSFIINKGKQTISFGALPAGKRFGDAGFDVSATGGASGNPVLFTASGACSITGTSVGIDAAGMCLITATQAGDDNFDAAAPVSQSTTFAKASQAITFGPLAGGTFGDAPFTVSATGGASGQPVTFTADGSCSVLDATVTINAAGLCSVTASQAGNGNYDPADPVTQSAAIGKANQSITFDPLADRTFGDAPFTVSASASSGLAVDFAAAGACTMAGATVTLTGGGQCTITASQGGSSNFNAAAPVARAFTINTPPPPPPPPSDNLLVNPGDQTNHEGDVIELELQLNEGAAASARRRGDDDDGKDNDDHGHVHGVFAASNLPAGLEIEKRQGVIRGRIRKDSASVSLVTITFTRDGESFTQQFTWTVLPRTDKPGASHR